MTDRLLTYSEAGARIMGLGPESIAALVRKKVLTARPVIVRGANKRPKRGILESEVERYLKSLPELTAEGRAPAPTRRSRVSGFRGLAAELAAVPVRCR